MTMKHSVSFRPRIVIKRKPDSLDLDEIGIVFNRGEQAFYLCPPNLTPEDEVKMAESWNMFFDFVELIPEFQFDMSWLDNMPEGIKKSCSKVGRLVLRTSG